MRTSCFALILALLSFFSISAASFDASDYLYSNESASSIKSQDFLLNGTAYSIVNISGSPAFLLKAGELVEARPEIDSVIHDHYLEVHYPSKSDLDSIRSLLEAYNDSRNDGNKFKGKEEYACREVIFVDGRVKSGNTPAVCKPDMDNCDLSAKFLYSYLAAVSGVPPVGSYTDLVPPIRDFGFASYNTEYTLNNISKKLDSGGNLYDSLKYTRDSIPNLKTYASTMEATKFGWLWKEQTQAWTIDSQHWALCPPIDLDQGILTQLESSLDALLLKMAPFAQYNATSSKLYSNTQARLKYHGEEINYSYYAAIYGPLSDEASEVISFAQYTDERVSNLTLKSDLTKLRTLHDKINKSLSDKNFSTIETDIGQYKLLVPKVNDTATQLFAVYNDTVSAKNNANSLVLILDTKDVDPLTAEKIAVLKNRTADLDAAFKSGLNEEKSVSFKENYSLIVDEASAIMSSIRDNPGSMVYLSFRSFSRKVNSGLATLLESASIMGASEIPENKAMAFGGFSLVTFLSLGAIISFVFLALLFTKRIFQAQLRYVLVAVFLVALLSLTAFSAFMYVYLDRTSTSADIEEFLIDLNGQEDVAILLDLRGAPFGAKDSMKECAGTVGSSMFAKNKSTVLYTLDTSGCTIKTYSNASHSTQTSAVDSCLSDMESAPSLISFNYSTALEKPNFSIIYTSRAQIAADSSYYSSCPFEGIFG